MDKPDFKRTKQMLLDFDKAAAELNEIERSQDGAPQEIRALTKAALEEKQEAVLRGIDVEQLNSDRSGIRVSALRKAGINDLSQLKGKTQHQIEMISGIGPDNAKKIYAAMKSATTSLKTDSTVRFDLLDMTPNEEKLLKRLYVLLNAEPLITQAKALKKEAAAKQTNADALSPAASALKWAFASRAKKETILAVLQDFSTYTAESFDPRFSELSEQFDTVTNADIETCRRDFERSAARYYALLEQKTGKKSAAPTDSGLSVQLTEQIEAIEADTTGLSATLRSYQAFGLRYILNQKRVLLGDEMGLGKTMQAIAAMVCARNAGQHHFMVICPASVVVNWCREIEKFSDLETIRVQGNNDEAELFWRENGGVLVTTFESSSKVEIPERFRFGMLVVDEAHYIKNPDTIRTRSVVRIMAHTDRVLFMSGTPLENRVEEMCFLISLLQPEIAAKAQQIKTLAGAKTFRDTVAPVYLRRKREDVLKELPELTERKEWCILLPEEKKVYENTILTKQFAQARRVSWNAPDAEQSSKAQRLLKIVDAAGEENRKVIVFSFFLDTIATVCELLGDRCSEPINGSVSPERRQKIVDRFNEAPGGSVLAAQIQSGGTGLNIQAASVVILCEPQFKPSIENQAISRAYRMGQTKNVLVYRLLCDDTVDERIMELVESKQAIFDAFANDSKAAETMAEVDEESFAKILEEERARIQAAREQQNPEAAPAVT